MDSLPTGPGRTLVTTRAAALGVALGLISVSFVAGWIVSRVASQKRVAAAIADVEAQHSDHLKSIQELPGLPMFAGPDGKWVDEATGLKSFRPTAEDSVTWSHIGGIEEIERHVKIGGDGKVTVSDRSGTKQIHTLSEASNTAFFKKVISSGLAAFSEEAVTLKMLLQQSHRNLTVCYAPTTRVRIVIPRLKVERQFDLYVPEAQAELYPDIIEFRSAVEIEKEILGFIP